MHPSLYRPRRGRDACLRHRHDARWYRVLVAAVAILFIGSAVALTDDGMASAVELTHSGLDGAVVHNVLAVASTGRTGAWEKLHVFRQSKQAAERTRSKG
jgi:hypothetical protein